jgi:hypothetical protein
MIGFGILLIVSEFLEYARDKQLNGYEEGLFVDRSDV